jgi:hypothetical protein
MLILKKLEHVQNMYLIQGNLFEHSQCGTCLEFKLILTRGKDWKRGGGRAAAVFP